MSGHGPCKDRYWKKEGAQEIMYSCQFPLKPPRKRKSLTVQGGFCKIVDVGRAKLCLLDDQMGNVRLEVLAIMIKFRCANCNQKLHVEDECSGKRVECPRCSRVSVAPDCPERVTFECTGCGRRISVSRAHAGRKEKCPKCKNPVVVPCPFGELADTGGGNGQSIFPTSITIDALAAGVVIILGALLLFATVRGNLVETLRQIPGPIFLGVFVVLEGVCIGVGRLWANVDRTDRYPLPELTCLDPIAIAALRGRSTGVIQAIILNLASQGLAEVTPRERRHWWQKKEFEIVSVPSRKRLLDPIEEKVYQFLETPIGSSKLYQSLAHLQIKQHLQSVYAELEDLHLSQFGTNRIRSWIAIIVMALVVGTVGGTKLYLGFMRSAKPVGFLVILLAVGLWVLFAVLKPREKWKIPTRLGRRYLKALEEHFDWLKQPATLSRKSEGIAPSLSIAIFGVGVMGGAAIYADLSRAIRFAFDVNPAREGGFFDSLRDFCSSISISGGCGGGCGGGGGGGCGGGCGGCGG